MKDTLVEAADRKTTALRDKERQIESLQTKLKESALEIKRLTRDVAVAEQRSDRITQLSERTDFDAWRRDTKKPGKIFATAILPTSDLHAEERVESREVSYLNEYNLKEAAKRFERLIRKQVEYVARYVWMAETVIWPILGDIINGVLREQALEANDASVMQTLDILGTWFDAAIEYQLREYKGLGLKIGRILVPCVCGNHGRAYKKLGDRVAYKNSYEWGFYHGLARRWRHEKRLDFRIADGDMCYVSIFGRTIRFHHGDSIKYSGGILGLGVPVHKKINRWNTGIRADLDVFGHFHQLYWGRDFVCNGSLVGYNAYAQQIGCEYEPPQQAFILFDQKWGIRQVTKIVCIDEPARAIIGGPEVFQTTTKSPADEYPLNIKPPKPVKRGNA